MITFNSGTGMDPKKVEALGQISDLVKDALKTLNTAVLIGELAHFEKETGCRVPVHKLKLMLEPLVDFQKKAQTRYRGEVTEQLGLKKV